MAVLPDASIRSLDISSSSDGSQMRRGAYYMRRLLSDVVQRELPRTVLVVVLMALASFFEGISLAMLFPLLALLGFSGGADFNGITERITATLGEVGVPVSIYSAGAILIGLILVQHICFLLQAWLAAGIQVGYSANWRRRLANSLLRSGWLYFTRKNAGELAHVWNLETGRASHLITYGVQTASFCLTALVYLLVAFIASWKVTLVIVACGAFILLFSQFIVRRPAVLSARQTELHTEFSGKSTEILAGMKLVRAVNGEAAVRAGLYPAIADLEKIERKVMMHPSVLRSSFEVAAIVALLGTLILAVEVLDSDGATVLLIAALFVRLFPRISAIQQNIHHFRMAIPYFAAVTDMLDEADEAAKSHPRAGTANAALAEPPTLTLRDVSIEYRGRPALRNVRPGDSPAQHGCRRRRLGRRQVHPGRCLAGIGSDP